MLAVLRHLPLDCKVIHGACRGADRMADSIARALGLDVTGYPAAWELYGKAAGMIRNKKLLDMNPDVVLSFIGEFEVRGTLDMIRQASDREIKVFVF